MATLYILYGSATGNAEGIAKDLSGKQLPSHFSSAVCKPLESFKRLEKEWIHEPTNGLKHGVIIVCSTTGNGDAPENASRFVRYIKRKQTADTMPFQHVAFSVLGLGDTNYDQFCETGKVIHRKLGELGGTCAKPLACADEATGLEDVVEQWMEEVLSDMQLACVGKDGIHDFDAEESKNCDTKSSDDVSLPTSSHTSLDVGLPPPERSEFPLFILYGSATGNAEQIAKDLSATYQLLLKNPDAKLFFSDVVCCKLDDFKKKCLNVWEQEPPPGTKHGLVIVASTTGNGDAPENADRFMRYIKRKQTAETSPFRHVCYSVLGLGDTNYDVFCATGKAIDKKLAELKGTRAKPLVCADEATGLEDSVEPWKNSILVEITKACRGEGAILYHDATLASLPLSSRGEEEKKADISETSPSNPSSKSYGVQLIRSILDLDPTTPLSAVDDASLPSLGSSRSSCELCMDDEGLGGVSRRKSSFDDRATVSSASSGTLHYTFNRPFESKILAARYLTKTPVDAAAEVSELLRNSGADATSSSLSAREILDTKFPLQGIDLSTAEKNGKRVLEMMLALPDDYTLEYQPGDALGLIATNTPEAVSFVLGMLRDHHGTLPSQKVSIDQNHPITVEDAVTEMFDLCTPIKYKKALHSLSLFATDPDEIAVLRLLCSKSGDSIFKSFLVEQRRSIIDVLKLFPSCQSVSLEGLLSILPSIPPRYYSVSSSPLDKDMAGPSLTVAFSCVDYLTPSMLIRGKETGRRRIHGIATGNLEILCSPFLCGSDFTVGSCVKVFPKPTAEFRLPSNLSTPMILIGPGTGIAPFIGFLKHRKAQLSSKESTDAANTIVEGTWRGGYELEPEDLPIGEKDASGLSAGADYRSHQKSGDVDLYFGCRHANHDWLYEDEMKALKAEGVVTNIFPAFSRDCETKKAYVQDVMVCSDARKQRVVGILLNKGGSVYICGDGNRMARDVQVAIANILGLELGGDSPIDTGKAYIDELKNKGRFLLDIWS